MIRRLSISLLCFLIISTSVSAEIPQIINYQGKVTDSAGDPVVDGTYNMRFRIYNVPAGGSELWNSGIQSVPVTDGIFNVLLGESPQPALDLTFDEDYWLFVTFDGINQIPRQRIGSVGYAYMASGLVAGTEVIGAVTSGTSAAIKGTNTITSGSGYGIFGTCASVNGTGVYGRADTYGVRGYTSASTGEVYGVHGSSESVNGFGVYGKNLNSEHYGYLGGNEYGVYGHHDDGSFGYLGGSSNGVYGENTSIEGRGVYGYASATIGGTYGVYGRSSSIYGCGVYGIADATSAGCTQGVYGVSSNPSGVGVYGISSATSGLATGVSGGSNSTEGRGVKGRAHASSGTTYGVYGQSDSTDGRGVFGYASQLTGNGQGVRGESDSSSNGVGVYGLGSSTTGLNYGVFGRTFSSDGYGVYGTGVAPGYALYAAGDFAASGTKSCVVKTSQGPTLMYCQESPENWFEDFGEGQLVNGRCHIELDLLFLETITIDEQNPMHVFIQPKGRCFGTFVETGDTGFDVIEQGGGTSNIAFSYRVVAKRKGFESKRLDYCKAAETDSYLHPELRGKELKGLEAK